MQASAPTSFDLVRSRLKDFFGRSIPWNRRLWGIGTVLSLREVLEYADACIVGEVPTTEGLQFVIHRISPRVTQDPGVSHLATVLEKVLCELHVTRPGKVPESSREELEQLIRRADAEYLQLWSKASDDVPVEFAARAIASHLLDAGFSAEHLYRWVQARVKEIPSIPELAAEALTMTDKMPRKIRQVFIPCSAPFQKPTEAKNMFQWLDGPAATRWLEANSSNPGVGREGAGFLLTVRERDPWAAINAAQTVIARADARVRVADRSNERIKPTGWALVAGSKRHYRLRSSPRQVEVESLLREHAVYKFDEGSPTDIDDALELASYMESPNTGAAVTGGWSAIEGLMIRPGERKHYLAADRLAALVTCSLPRAELTPLAYRHQETASDDLADALAAAQSNSRRVQLVEAHLRRGRRLALTDVSDITAQNRMVAMFSEPYKELERIRGYVTESLRRLYNQRNMIVHSGSLRSVVLSATLRTAFSLVGAGLDRIVHAQLTADCPVKPLSLVARAETELCLVGSPGGRELGSLLN